MVYGCCIMLHLAPGLFIKIEDLSQPFNAISYVMVARYAVQATVVNEFTCCFAERLFVAIVMFTLVYPIFSTDTLYIIVLCMHVYGTIFICSV